MSRTEVARGKTAVGGHDADQQLVVGDVDLDRFQCAGCGEGGHRVDERNPPARGQPRCYAHQVVLGDAEVEVLLAGRCGVLRAEQAGVGVQADQVGMSLQQRKQTVPVGLPGRAAHLAVSVVRSAPIARAWLRSDSVT